MKKEAAKNGSGKIDDFLQKIFGTNPNDKESLQPKEAISYSVAGFGQNLVFSIIASYLSIFMTDALLMADTTYGRFSGATSVAMLMLFTRIFDALNDPVMGSIVDKTRTPYGKCRPYLKWMAVPIAVVTILCFLPMYTNSTKSFVSLCITYVIWSVVFTIVDVPYWGLSTAMTNDTTVRGKVLTIARLLCSGGAGLVVILVPFITSKVTEKFKNAQGLLLPEYALQNAETLKWTYFYCALILSLVSIPLFYIGFKNTRERYTAEGEPPTLGHNFRLLFANDQLMLILLSGILGCARVVYMFTGALYFCKYILGNEALFGLMTILVAPGGLIASLMVPWFTKKWGKKKTYIYVHALGAVVMFIMYFIGRNGGYNNTTILLILAVGFVLLGIPQGVNNVITYAMIGDTVEYLEWKTGERAEGVCFSVQTFINKIGTAAGAFIGVYAYDISGISPSDPINTVTAAGGEKLWAWLILSGAISMVLTIIPIIFYKVTEDKQREYVKEVAERKITGEKAPVTVR